MEFFFHVREKEGERKERGERKRDNSRREEDVESPPPPLTRTHTRARESRREGVGEERKTAESSPPSLM